MNKRLDDVISTLEQKRLDILCEEDGSCKESNVFIIFDELRILRRLVRALIDADERGQGIQWDELMDELNRRVP